MIKAEARIFVLCMLIISVPILAEETIFWELGVAIKSNPQSVTTPQTQVPSESTVGEKMGIIIPQSKTTIRDIQKTILKYKVTTKLNNIIKTKNMEPTFDNAKLAFLSEKYSLAVDIYEELQPSSSSSTYWHATALFRLGNFHNALELLESSEKRNDDILFLQGAILKSLDKTDSARECFSRLILDFPTSDYVSSSKIQIAMLRE